MDKLYSVDEVITYTHISRTTLWRWVRDGRFPDPIRLGPRRRVWRESDLQEWMNGLERGVGHENI